jgi:hypothetical protein
LQAALNGDRVHPATPHGPEEIAVPLTVLLGAPRPAADFADH